MATSTLYAYGGTGDSMYVSERVPNHRDEKITGGEAQRIYDSADFICVSAVSRGQGEWILHAKDGGGGTVPYRQSGDYGYLATECEKIAGKGDLIILFC